MNINNKKKRMLAIKTKKEKKTKKRKESNIGFLGILLSGRYKKSAMNFLFLSLLVATASSLFYQLVFSNAILTIGVFIPTLLFPYCYVSCNEIIRIRVDDIMGYKSFLEYLEAELTITNSTIDALNGVTEQKLHPHIKMLLDHILKNVRMGKSLEESLTEAENLTKYDSIKMIFVTLKINHSVGSSETLTGLRSIGHNFDVNIKNIMELKEKVSGGLKEKSMLLVLELYTPVFLEIYQKGYFSDIFPLGPIIPMIIVAVFIVAIFSQFLIEIKIKKVLEVI